MDNRTWIFIGLFYVEPTRGTYDTSDKITDCGKTPNQS